MAKFHTYPDEEEQEDVLSEDLETAEKMLAKFIESVEDLMKEVAFGQAKISVEQEREMENLLKDARKAGLH